MLSTCKGLRPLHLPTKAKVLNDPRKIRQLRGAEEGLRGDVLTQGEVIDVSWLSVGGDLADAEESAKTISSDETRLKFIKGGSIPGPCRPDHIGQLLGDA